MASARMNSTNAALDKLRPTDPRRVVCPSCGAARLVDCTNLNTGKLEYFAHAARQKLVDRLNQEVTT